MNDLQVKDITTFPSSSLIMCLPLRVIFHSFKAHSLAVGISLMFYLQGRQFSAFLPFLGSSAILK
jgi:hypothetical protein